MAHAAITIYGLVDPRTDQLRYIGQTVRLPHRLRHHVKPAALRDESYRTHWLRALRRAGLRPEPVVLESVPNEDGDDAERFWIAYFRSIGASLTNHGTGGNAGGRAPGFRHSEETKAKIRAARAQQPHPMLGRKHSAETLAKLSAWQIGKRLSPEHRAHISAGLLGKKRGPYTKRAR